MRSPSQPEHGTLLSEGRNRTKARLRRITWEGQPAVEKDYSQRGLLVRRLLGPWHLDREEMALRRLEPVEGVPRFLARPSRARLIMEAMDGTPLARHTGPPAPALAAAFFPRLRKLVDAVHARGVAQGDIGSRDVLVGADGAPALLDFSVCTVRGRGWLGRLHGLAARNDLRRLARLHQRFSPADLSGEERALLVNHHGLGSRSPAGLLRLAAVFALLAVLAFMARPQAWDILLGLPLVMAGAAVRIWAAGYLLKTNELAVGGPYAHVRHPLYLGRLLLFSGFALMARLPGFANLAVAVAGLAVFFLYYMPRKERVEGARLEARHGERYRCYRGAVPALLPRPVPYREAETPPSPGWQASRFRRNREALMLFLEAGLLLIFAARLLWPVA